MSETTEQPSQVLVRAAHACRLVDREHKYGRERSRIETAEALIIEAAERRAIERQEKGRRR